jgi:hypothetical protein
MFMKLRTQRTILFGIVWGSGIIFMLVSVFKVLHSGPLRTILHKKQIKSGSRGNVSAPGARRASFVTRALPVDCCC